MRKEKLEELKQYIEELRTVKIERRLQNKNPFLKSEAYYYTLKNGIILPREKIIKGNNNGSAVIVMPITKNNEILTVIEPRVFTKEGIGIGFPSGYIESGEEPRIAAFRELREETGYTTKEKLIHLDSFYQDEGCSEAYNHSFIATNCEKTNDQKLDPDEVVKYMLFNYDELFELEKMGYISGSNSKLTLEKSKQYLKRRS